LLILRAFLSRAIGYNRGKHFAPFPCHRMVLVSPGRAGARDYLGRSYPTESEVIVPSLFLDTPIFGLYS
jgi:hypothetical protein